MENFGLLDYLARCCCLEYVSDLRYTLDWKPEINKIQDDTFPLSEWNDAIRYLCGERIRFNTVTEAKNCLLTHSNV